MGDRRPRRCVLRHARRGKTRRASFQSDGLPIQIEVKTTNLGPRSPFYVTRNEVAKSEELADTYRLYRVFDFARDARVFVVPGSVRDGFAIEPMDYVARVS